MKHQGYYILHATMSLLSGGGIYLLFREGTYLHQLLGFSQGMWCEAEFAGDIFVRYHLPDFLWAYSLAMTLNAALPTHRYTGVGVAIAVAVLGCLWEWLQLKAVVPGTFDGMDCWMYSMAAVVSYGIYKK